MAWKDGNRRTGGGSCSCGLCDGANPSAGLNCPTCVNARLNKLYNELKALRQTRDSLYLRLSAKLAEKKKADNQQNCIAGKRENVKKRSDFLSRLKKLLEEKINALKISDDIKSRKAELKLASDNMEKKRSEILDNYYPNLIRSQELRLIAVNSELLQKQSLVVKQICKLFPMHQVNLEQKKKDGDKGPHDQICYARLPRGLDPHSVPLEELGASLGYMVQLLNLITPVLAAPVLHISGYAGSCSRIWQRDSYWKPRPSQNKEYPLYIARRNNWSSADESSWSDKSASNFGVASVNSERKALADTMRSSSFNMSSDSRYSTETNKELQMGISLLKRSVMCITTYCYNLLGFDYPSDVSTFEAFGKLLATLSSSKELRSAFASKMALSRSDKQGHPLTRSIWNVASGISSNASLPDSAVYMGLLPSFRENHLACSGSSFLLSAEIIADYAKPDNLAEGWDMVERVTLPPPPSHAEDVEHWARAMFTDATRKKL